MDTNEDTHCTTQEPSLSPTTATVAAPTRKRQRSSTTPKQSSKPKKTKNTTKHPNNNNNNIRHCMCSHPSCRKIMTRWLRLQQRQTGYDHNIGSSFVVEYLRLPWEVPGDLNTPNARHVAAFRDGVLRYLNGRAAVDEEDVREDRRVEEVGSPRRHSAAAAATAEADETMQFNDNNNNNNNNSNNNNNNNTPIKQTSKQDKRIAFCHFHPKIIQILLQEKEQYMLKRYKWRISSHLAEEVGLDLTLDKCPDPDENGQDSYFALPNYPLEKALIDIEEAESAHAQTIQKFASSIPTKRIIRQIASNPQKYAIELSTLRIANSHLAKEIDRLKHRLKSETAKCIKMESKYDKMENKLNKLKLRLSEVQGRKKDGTVVNRRLGRPKMNPDVQQQPQQQQQQQHLQQYTMQNTLEMNIGQHQQQPNSINNTIQTVTSTLEHVNYPNNVTSHDEKWEFRYGQLVEYRNRFGNCDVPRKWVTNKSLGKWVDNQRVMNAQGRLPQGRVNRLSALGFTWRKNFPAVPQNADPRQVAVAMPPPPMMSPQVMNEEGVPLGMGMFIPDESFR